MLQSSIIAMKTAIERAVERMHKKVINWLESKGGAQPFAVVNVSNGALQLHRLQEHEGKDLKLERLFAHF